MATFKALRDRDYSVVSFKTHQSQSYGYVSGSTSNPEQMSIDLGLEPVEDFLLNINTGSSVPGLKNDSGRYAYTVFPSVVQSFYNPSASVTEVTKFYPTSSCYVVSIAGGAYGEQIKPGSFKLKVSGSSNTIVDNTRGILKVNNTIVGNIFYDFGIAVVHRNESATSGSLDYNGLSLSENDSASVSFNSTLTIYEHTAVCRMEPRDFNWTWNPSLLSGSNESGVRVYDQFASGSLTPYVTTIGLYNEFGELMATAKISSPLPRSNTSAQTIIIKFDT